MLSRAFLSARQVTRVSTRGKALQGWVRPSIDEMGVPTEPWKRVHEKNNRKYNLQVGK